MSLATSHEPTVERHQTEHFFVNPITFSTFPIPAVVRISVVHTILSSQTRTCLAGLFFILLNSVRRRHAELANCVSSCH